MCSPFIGEVRLFTFPTANNLQGWLPCDGSILNVGDYGALANLLGATYGGDGQTTFGLPDLRGRVPMGGGGVTPLAATGGAEAITLMQSQIPAHSHQVTADGDGGTALTANMAYPAAVSPDARKITAQIYASESPTVALAATSVTPTGAGGPHANVQPSIVLQYCIAYEGLYPQRP